MCVESFKVKHKCKLDSQCLGKATSLLFCAGAGQGLAADVIEAAAVVVRLRQAVFCECIAQAALSHSATHQLKHRFIFL